MKNITVPINQEAMEKLNYDTCEKDELIELYLDENQYKELWNSKVLEAFNEKINIMIDDFEDESIHNIEYLKLSRNIAIDFIKINPHNNSLKKLLELIDIAIENKTGIFFYF